MSMRVFLTGASGYVGGVLTDYLARLPEVESITGIGLSAPDSPLPSKLQFVRMDIRSPELHKLMAGHDAVIHTACVVLWSARMSRRERDDINLAGVENVGRAALRNEVRCFLHCSSMAAYDPGHALGKTDVTEDFPIGRGRSPFYYWNAKAAAERTLMRVFEGSSTRLTLLRPIYIVGPRGRAVVERYRKNAINFPGQNPRRQFIHEQDVAGAFLQSLRTDMAGAFNVVPDDFIRMSDVWRILGVSSVPTVPLSIARLVTWFRWRWLGSPIHPSWVRDTLVDFTGSNAKLKATGWQPHYGSAAALESALCMHP